MKPPSPVTDTTGFAGIRHFGAERRREAEAECALEPFGDIGSRREDRKRARVRREADLRQLGHEDAVARQNGTDRPQERRLRLDAVDRGVGDAFRRGDLGDARAARHNAAAETLGEQPASRRGIGDDRDVGLEALHLGSIDVDADQLRAVRRLALVAHRIAPAHVRHLEAAADADEHVDVVPQLARSDARDSERVVFGHDAAAAAKSRDGCLERLGEQLAPRCAACCAPAPHMIMGFLAAASSRTAASMACGSTGLRTAGLRRRLDDGRRLRRHRVPAHLDGDRAGSAAGRVAKRPFTSRDASPADRFATHP